MNQLSRRHVLLGGLTLAAVAACTKKPTLTDPAEPVLPIHERIEALQRRQLEDWMRGNTTSSMRAGLPPGWTTADKTGSGDYGSTNDVGIAYGPDRRKALLAMMTRSQANDPKAENLRPLIAEVTPLALPWLITPG